MGNEKSPFASVVVVATTVFVESRTDTKASGTGTGAGAGAIVVVVVGATTGSIEIFPEMVRRFDAIHRLAVGKPDRFVLVRVRVPRRTVGMNQAEAPVVSFTFP